jgi:hypothetical protein
MSVLKLPLLVDVQQKVGQLAFYKFFSFNHCSRKYFKLVRRRNVVMVSLTTDTMLVLFTYVYTLSGRGKFYEGGPPVC